jgi:hypothetical protein
VQVLAVVRGHSERNKNEKIRKKRKKEKKK